MNLGSCRNQAKYKNKVQITFYTDAWIKRELKLIAKKENKSVADILNGILRKELK